MQSGDEASPHQRAEARWEIVSRGYDPMAEPVVYEHSGASAYRVLIPGKVELRCWRQSAIFDATFVNREGSIFGRVINDESIIDEESDRLPDRA